MTMRVIFNNEPCLVKKTTYADNQRMALALICEDKYKSLMTVATVNLPGYPLKDNEVAIKDYSENAGILQVLVEAGIISTPHDYTTSGCVLIPICKYTGE